MHILLKRYHEFCSGKKRRNDHRAQKCIYPGGEFLNASAVASSIVNHGMTNLNGDTDIGKSFFECIEAVDQQDSMLFSRYLVLKHAMEWVSDETGGDTKRVFADETLQDKDRIYSGRRLKHWSVRILSL